MNPSIGILLPNVGVYPALGAMLQDVVPKLGWRTAVRHRADPTLLSSDVLLVCGLCRYIDGLPGLLARRSGGKPATALWQLEPLPPVQVSPIGRTIGRRVAACDWGRIPLAPRRVLECFVPYRTRLMRAARQRLARPYSRHLEQIPGAEGWKHFEVENFFNAMADWHWIQRAHARGWLDHYFASNGARADFLRSRGIVAATVPFGHHPSWGQDQGLKRDIDVLFLGKLGRGPRGEALQQFQEDLSRHGRELTIVPKAYGTARDRLLSRARVVLNLLRVPHDLAGMRVVLGMSCGALVLSEHCEDTGPFRPGEHLVMANAEHLAERARYYLEHEAERDGIARQGQRFVIEELTLANSIRKMLRQIEEKSLAK